MKVLDTATRLGDDYEILGVLGRGGMGIVYLAEDLQTQGRCALKTFLAESLKDKNARENFRAEALLWVNLERHANILAARAVREYSNQLFVHMDYIAPNESGCVTLADYLSMPSPPWDEPQILRLAIQFCYGMQHAQKNGLRVHRDIKPANVLIGSKTTLKIADFGIALPSEYADESDVANEEPQAGVFRVFLNRNTPMAGTPGYLPPEILEGAEPDIRSDIYCFGLILAQLSTHNPLPPFFMEAQHSSNFLESIRKLQKKAKLQLPRNSYRKVVRKCLEYQPHKRFANFFDLGDELRRIYREEYRRDLLMRGPNDDDLGHLNAKAASLEHLHNTSEAITIYERILSRSPDYSPAISNLGSLLAKQGKFDQALPYLERAVKMEPGNATVLANFGNVLNRLHRHQDALESYISAIKTHPDHYGAWLGRSGVEHSLGRLDKAAASVNQAIRIYPSSTSAWHNKAIIERARSRHLEALKCWDQLRKLDNSSIRPIAESIVDLVRLGNYEGANQVFDELVLPALRKSDERDAAINLYFNEAFTSAEKTDYEYALNMYGRVLRIAPDDDEARYNRGALLLLLNNFPDALKDLEAAVDSKCTEKEKLYNLGVAYFSNEKFQEASRILRLALRLDNNYDNALYLLAAVEHKRGRTRAAADACKRYLSLPNLESESMETIRKLLTELQSNL